MKILLYTGDHAKDGLAARAGWWLTQLGQKGEFGYITHTETIHEEHSDGSVTIVSSSLRDGGVRSKRVFLNPNHWRVADMPQWPVGKSQDFFGETKGDPYDLRGAVATLLPGAPKAGHWFCSQWIAHPFLRSAATFGPHLLAALVMSLGREISAPFFRDREGIAAGARL